MDVLHIECKDYLWGAICIAWTGQIKIVDVIGFCVYERFGPQRKILGYSWTSKKDH